MNEKYIKIAINEANKAYFEGEIPVGVVIVKDDVILSKAHNNKEREKIVFKHAEINAIEEASKIIGDWRLDGAILYTTLFPCPMCASAIQQARINKVVYINDSTNAELMNISKSILNNDNFNHKVRFFKVNNKNNNLKKFFKEIRNNVSRETL